MPNLVETLGNVGHNNIYLLGHAYGVFKPFVTYYTNHRHTLPKGLDLYYADHQGRVTHYRMTFNELVALTSSVHAHLIYDDLATPSVTIQTCWNASGTIDLMVRFVAVR